MSVFIIILMFICICIYIALRFIDIMAKAISKTSSVGYFRFASAFGFWTFQEVTRSQGWDPAESTSSISAVKGKWLMGNCQWVLDGIDCGACWQGRWQLKLPAVTGPSAKISVCPSPFFAFYCTGREATNIYIYIYIYVYIHTYTCACKCTYAYTTKTYMHARMHTSSYVHTYMRTYNLRTYISGGPVRQLRECVRART